VCGVVGLLLGAALARPSCCDYTLGMAATHVFDPSCHAEYALSQPDVYFVTVRQLIAWMEDPVPADQLTPQRLGCGNAGGAPRQPPSTRRRHT
jgi:hypothetical protein